MNIVNRSTSLIKTIEELAQFSDYFLVDTLSPDPEATIDGIDHYPRQVYSGHYVPVNPTPLMDPVYLAHSKNFFSELGFDDSLAETKEFIQMFSGDLSKLPPPMRKLGWATGYALSIYGTEYIQQCPFKTGNGYGDGRAVSILEANLNGKHYEMQLKGGGRTPYCRGADGRAVLRSSVREFLAQEHMNALGIPTSRSLSLIMSQTETVHRRWFKEGSLSRDPEVMINESVAITTRVASSFLRVGQIELFGRRARKNEHPKTHEELRAIIEHLIAREYKDEIAANLPIEKKVILLAKEFQNRLTSLVAQWIRVGFCQGNFNSDNCAAGGFTLDYGPFGFMDMFNFSYQPWTGGGDHFSFFNQPEAARRNFLMFTMALKVLLAKDESALRQLEEVENNFSLVMKEKIEIVWASKLGLNKCDAGLVQELLILMSQSQVDYTLFFRELSSVPETISQLKVSFYKDLNDDETLKWSQWLEKWKSLIQKSLTSLESREELSRQMKLVNPKYTLREWILVPAYQAANRGDFTILLELQEVMTNPYAELSKNLEDKYYKKKPTQYFEVAGISHVSCSS